MRSLLITLLIIFSSNAFSMALNFDNADIRSVVSAVSDATGKNIIIDSNVKGKITVYGNTPVDDRHLLDVFESILEVNGFSLIKGKYVSKVVPSAKAKYTSGIVKDASDGFVTRAILVEHVDPTQLIPVLRPLLPQHAHIAAHSESRTIVVADTSENVVRIQSVVSKKEFYYGNIQ